MTRDRWSRGMGSAARVLSWTAIAAGLLGCGDVLSSGGGTLEVTVSVNGSGSDADGFVVSVGDREAPVQANGMVQVTGLEPRSYRVDLENVADQCEAPDARRVTVDADEITRTAVEVACTGGFGYSSASGEQRVLRVLTSEGLELEPTQGLPGGVLRNWVWSPDGSQVAVEWDVGGRSLLYVVALDGTGQRLISEDYYGFTQPSWAPDGEQLAYSERRGAGSALMVADVTSGENRELFDQSGRELRPAWAPDGTRIAFYYEDGLERRIGIIDVAGGDPEWPIPGDANYPAWSPDGQVLAFETSRRGRQEIWYQDLTGSNTPSPFAEDLESSGYAEWSPNGEQVLLQGYDRSDRRFFIAAVPRGGGEWANVSPGLALAQSASWERDGQRILMAGREPTTSTLSIWTVSAAGLDRRQVLTPVGRDDYRVAVRPRP